MQLNTVLLLVVLLGVLQAAAAHARALRHAPRATAASASHEPSCAHASTIPTASNTELIAKATLCLINQRRKRAGDGALVLNEDLQLSAVDHSLDMVTRNYFAHTSPTAGSLLDRILAVGYVTRNDLYEVGENIALGTSGLASPKEIVAAWMNSPPHRENILNPDFRNTGIGVVAQAPAKYSRGQTGATYTEDFGVRPGYAHESRTHSS